MELKSQTQSSALTKEDGVFLNSADAEEYRLYKKRKKLTEISSALTRSVSTLTGGEDVQRTCERAVRLRQIAVKTPLSRLAQAAFYLSGSHVRIDCVIGGTGETLTKVKTYETRLALRRHANEITLLVTPSYLDACRYGEIRREIRRIVRTAGKAGVKVRVEKTFSPATLSRLARLASECGARYFSVPFFGGCEKLRLDLTNGCALEVSGVEKLSEYRKLTEAGVGRIVTDRAWEIYSEWLKEVNEIASPTVKEKPSSSLPVVAKPPVKEKEPPAAKPPVEENSPVSESEKTPTTPPALQPAAKQNEPLLLATKDPETEYRCRLENGGLKFY